MNRHERRKRRAYGNDHTNHTERLRKESFDLGYCNGLEGEQLTSLDGILACEYMDGYSHGERDRMIALEKAALITQTLSVVAQKKV